VLRSRSVIFGSALVAALLANYWVLEDLLADRHDFDTAWISDLSTRSEGSGGVFVALGVVAAVALLIYGGVLVAALGRQGPWLRAGAIAFVVAAAFTLVAAAAPLSCAEGLEAACHLRDDAGDVVHSIATGGEIAATVLAFALLGIGLLRGGRREFGWATLALGTLWLVLTIVTGVSYLSDGVDEIKGAFQRGGQVVFGIWLVALAVAAAPRADEGGSDPPAG
jgi:hypothetical protein